MFHCPFCHRATFLHVVIVDRIWTPPFYEHVCSVANELVYSSDGMNYTLGVPQGVKAVRINGHNIQPNSDADHKRLARRHRAAERSRFRHKHPSLSSPA